MTELTEQTLATVQLELQQAHAFQAATDEVLHAIAASPGDPQPVFDVIADCALRLCEAQFSAVGRFDGELVHLAATRGASSELVQAMATSFPMPPGRGSALAEVVLEQATLNTADILDEADYTFREKVGRAGFRSGLGIPLMYNGDCLGSIGVLRTTLGLFSDPLVKLMQTFADQAVIAIENARLFHATREALEHQTASTEVLRVVSDSVADAQPVFEKIVESCARLFSTKHVALWLLDGDEHIALAAHRAEVFELDDNFPREIALDESVTAIAIRERRTVHYPHVTADSELTPFLRALHEAVGDFSFITAPLLINDTAIGSIILSRYPADPYTPAEIALLTTFADQAVIAIENARMFRETQEALERQTATAEILKVISQSPTDVQPVFDAIVARAAALTGADTAVATRLAAGQLHLVSVVGATEEELAGARAVFPVEPNSHTLNGRAALAKGPVQIPDFSLDSHYGILIPSRGAASGLAVPLLLGERVLGTLMVVRNEVGTFPEQVVDLFQTFADQAVIAIENTRLFRETQEALERQTATAEILQVISESPTDVQPVFDVIVERARAICGAGVGTLTSYDGEYVQLVADVGLPPDMSARYSVSPFLPGDSDTVSIRAILSGKSAQIPDMQVDAQLDYQDLAQKSSFRSALAVPMLSEGRCIGAIGVAREEIGEFPDKLVTLLQTFASQAVIALQNVRLFNETREALERQTATAEVLKVISSSVADTQPVFEKILESCESLFGVKTNAIFRVDADQQVHMAAHRGLFFDDVMDFYPAPFAGSFTEQAFLSQTILHMPDSTVVYDDLQPQYRQIVDQSGHCSWLVAPLRRSGVGIGSMVVLRAPPKPFSDKEIALLTTFADQAVIAIENARLFKATEEALERQTATADILKVVSESPTDVQPVFEAIIDSALALSGAPLGIVTRYDGDRLHLAAYRAPGADPSVLAAFPLAPDRSTVSGRAVLDRTAIEIPDIRREAGYLEPFKTTAQEQSMGSALGVPMMLNGACIGTFSLLRPETGTWPERIISVMETFAAQAVIAIENVRLFRETEVALERQTAMSDVLQVISESPTDIQPVFDAIAERAAKLCDASYGFSFRIDGGLAHLVGVFGASEDVEVVAQEMFPVKPDRSTIVGRALVDGVPAQAANAAAYRAEYLHSSEVPSIGARGILAVPMLRDGEVIGGLGVARDVPSSFSDSLVSLLQTFAAQAVIAVENVRLFNETREALEHQTAVSEILRVTTESPTTRCAYAKQPLRPCC